MYKLALVLLMCCFMGSCVAPKKLPTVFKYNKATPIVKKTQVALKEVEQGIDNSVGVIKQEVKVIQSETVEVEKKVSVETRPIVSPHLNTIRKSSETIQKQADKILDMNTKIVRAYSDLDQANHNIQSMEDVTATAISERDAALSATANAEAKLKEAEDEGRAAQAVLLRWLVLLCVVGVGFAGLLLWMGNYKFAGLIAVGSITTMVMAIVVTQYFEFIALGGLVLLVAAIAFVVYQLIQKQRAVEEIVHTTELVKNKLSEEDQAEIFGSGAKIGMAYNLQSKSTENIVARARRKLDKVWSPNVTSNRSPIK